MEQPGQTHPLLRAGANGESRFRIVCHLELSESLALPYLCACRRAPLYDARRVSRTDYPPDRSRNNAGGACVKLHSTSSSPPPCPGRSSDFERVTSRQLYAERRRSGCRVAN
jgi:hypothetical protein